MVSSNEEYFYRIEDAIDDIKNGNIMIIVDDRSVKNEGVFFQAAEKTSGKSINFFMTHGKSLIYLACLQERLIKLKIPMAYDNPILSMSIDASGKTGSGSSANDRALTIKTFLDPASGSEDFIMPGHIFPSKISRWWCPGKGRTCRSSGRSCKNRRSLSGRRNL